MAIVTIQSTDLITNSRANLNNNFADLEANKLPTSYLDTDTTLATNSDVRIPTQKAIKAYVDANAVPNSVSVESTASTTHSLTTIAGQTVMVLASGMAYFNGSGTQIDLALKYNGVTKHSYTIDTDGTGAEKYAFSMMYTEIPGAATANITVTASAGAISSVVIMVLKL
jgi:hypothetical protein